MATLYDQSGQPVDVPDTDLTKSLVSGQLGTDKASVQVRAKSGKVYEVPTENLAKFNQSMGGVSVLSDAQIAAHQAEKAQEKQQEEYGGAGSQLAAAGIGAADALTLGAGTGIVGALGGESVKNYIKSVEAANPISHGIGTALGLIAPALLTGGGSLLEEAPEATGLLARFGGALTAPTRALGEVGGLASKAVRAGAGEGTLARLAGGAVQGSLEGAVYGAGSQASEDIIQDHELTAERLLAGAGRGAIFGGGLGLGLSGLGIAAEKRLSKIADVAEGGLGDKIAKAADEMAFRSTGAKTPEFRKIAGKGLEADEVGNWMNNEMPAFAEGGNAPISREGILKASENAMADAGPKIASHIETLDQVGARPDGVPVFERVRREVLDELAKSIDPRAQQVGKLVGQVIDNAQAKFEANPTFQQLYDLRQELDHSIKWNKSDPAQITANNVMRQARGVVEDEIGKQGALALGPQWQTGYNAAKNQYRMAKTVAEVTDASLERIAGHRTGLSLTGTILAGHGIGALSLAHPAASIAALGAVAANHLIREYGDAVGARLLNKISHIDAIRGMDFDFSAKTSDAVRRFLNTGHAGAVGNMVTLPGSFADKKKEIDQLSSNPELFAASMAPHLPAAAPKVSGAMAQKAQGAVDYLKQTMPQGIPTGSTLTPQITMKPSKIAQHEWLQKVDVWENPLGVLKDMQKGQLSPGKADALKTIYPKLFEDIQKHIISQVSDKAAKNKEVPYRARVQMGILFGVAADATMTPEFVQSQQAIYAQPPKQEGASSGLEARAPATAAKMKMAGPSSIGTEAQRIEENHGMA